MRPIGWISLGRALIHIIFLFPMDGTGDRFGTTYETCLSADQASHQFVRARRQRRSQHGSQAWRAFCVRTSLQPSAGARHIIFRVGPSITVAEKATCMIVGVSRKSRNAHTRGTTPQLTPQVVFADAENLRFLLVRAIKQIERRASAGPGE